MADVLLLSTVGLFVVLLAALSTPVRLHFSWRSQPEPRLSINARPFGGLVPALALTGEGREVANAPGDDEKKTPRQGQGLDWLRAQRLLVASPDLILGLLRPLRIERAAIDAAFGLGDPAETGQVYGLLAPLVFAAPRRSAVMINLRPDFGQQRLSGEAGVRLRFIPAALALPLARFAWRAFGPEH